MAIMLIILFVLASFNFIIEAIILPEIRVNLRFKLFVLRDELRSMKIEDKINDSECEVLQNNINTALLVLPHTNFSMIRSIKKEVEANPKLKESIEKRSKFISESKNERLKEIQQEINGITVFSIFCNTFALIPYVLIILIPLIIFGGLINKIRKQASNLSNLKTNDAEKYINDYESLAVY